MPIVVVVIAENLTSGGLGEVAHDHRQPAEESLLVLAPGETMAYFGPPADGLSFDRLPRSVPGWLVGSR